MQNFRQYYISIDPGLIRLRLASKAILVTLIVLIIGMYFLPPRPLFIAGLAASMMYVCHHAELRVQRKWTILLAGFSFTIAVLLGSGLKHFQGFGAWVLILLTFAVFYVSRFGERYRMLPVFAGLFYILALFLPLGHFYTMLMLAVLMLLSAGVAFVTYVWIWPDQPRQVARHYAYQSFTYLHEMLDKFCVTIRRHDRRMAFVALAPQVKNGIVRTTELMRLLDYLQMAPARQEIYQTLTVKLYAATKLLAVLRESFCQLSTLNAEQCVLKPLLPHLSALSQIAIQLAAAHRAQATVIKTIDFQAVQHGIDRLYHDGWLETLADDAAEVQHFYNIIFALQLLLRRFEDMHAILVKRDELNAMS